MLQALGIDGLPLFAAAALLLNLTPGPDMLFVVGSAAAGGKRAGTMAALGIGAGCLLHVALAVFGVTAVLAASPSAFEAVRWLGAAYLVWAGLALLRQRLDAAAAVPSSRSGRSVFWQGALTNTLNPKVALFFLAFLPLFVAADAPDAWLGMLLLGLLFNAGGTVVNVVVALAVGTAGARLAADGSGARWLSRSAGALFVALGVRLALAR
jgi:threonine/homoserine/homoserine lactone efflux protein